MKMGVAKIKVKDKIRKNIKGRNLIVLWPGKLYEAKIYGDGSIWTESPKYNISVELIEEEVIIVNYL